MNAASYGLTVSPLGHTAADIRTRGPWRAGFAINGRFYSQPTTGVQRYAREITLGIDSALDRANGRGRIFTPATERKPQPLAALDVCELKPLQGHAWEQIVLPALCRMPILNLCNTAPAVNTRQVVCMHDANVFVQPDSYSVAFRLAYRALLPWLARRAVRVTSVSKASAMQLASHLPITAREIDVIPNGHEHVFRWNAEASTLAGRFAGHRPFVLLLGSRAKHKNAKLILDQADALDRMGLDLVIAGGGADIFTRLAAVNCNNVIQLGFVSDDDLAFLYSRALCLAFPSITEGFGLPIVEAMALGCPVVSSDRASMPEVCGTAALLADCHDKAAWHAHFAALAGSPALRQDLCGRGYERVKLFTWAESAQAYLSLFGDVA